MKNKLWYIPAAFFVAAAIANLCGCVFSEDMASAVKPALLPLVALTTVCFAFDKPVSLKGLGLLVAAQLLGCAGDILLIHSGEFLLFAGGMVAFLLGHVCYLCLFGKYSWKGMKAWQWGVSIVVMACLIFGLIKVIGINGALLAPMAVYACGLVLLPFAGLCGVIRLKGCTWWIIFCGGLLFLFSDSMIAVSTFMKPSFAGMHLVVMSTYLAAQVLLAIGALRLLGSRDGA